MYIEYQINSDDSINIWFNYRKMGIRSNVYYSEDCRIANTFTKSEDVNNEMIKILESIGLSVAGIRNSHYFK